MDQFELDKQYTYSCLQYAIKMINKYQCPIDELPRFIRSTRIFIDDYANDSDVLKFNYDYIVYQFGNDFDVSLLYIANTLFDILAEFYGQDYAGKILIPVYNFIEAYGLD